MFKVCIGAALALVLCGCPGKTGAEGPGKSATGKSATGKSATGKSASSKSASSKSASGAKGGGAAPAPVAGSKERCASNMRMIVLACVQHSDDKRFFPHVGERLKLSPLGSSHEALSLLLKFGYLDSPAAFVCPATKAKPATGGVLKPENLSYLYVRRLLNSRVRSTRILLVEEPHAHADKDGKVSVGGHVAHADGSVVWSTSTLGLAAAKRILTAGGARQAKLSKAEIEALPN